MEFTEPRALIITVQVCENRDPEDEIEASGREWKWRERQPYQELPKAQILLALIDRVLVDVHPRQRCVVRNVAKPGEDAAGSAPEIKNALELRKPPTLQLQSRSKPHRDGQPPVYIASSVSSSPNDLLQEVVSIRCNEHTLVKAGMNLKREAGRIDRFGHQLVVGGGHEQLGRRFPSQQHGDKGFDLSPR